MYSGEYLAYQRRKGCLHLTNSRPLAEMAPKEIRGKLGSMFHFLFTCGVMTSYWVDYGVSENLPKVARQWQIPIGLQVCGRILHCSTFALPLRSTTRLDRGQAIGCCLRIRADLGILLAGARRYPGPGHVSDPRKHPLAGKERPARRGPTVSHLGPRWRGYHTGQRRVSVCHVESEWHKANKPR